MTVQSGEQARPVAPACHEHQDPVAPASDRIPRLAERRASRSALAVVLALPRWAQILGGGAVVLAALLAVGVPLASLAPLLAIGGCLAMHLFMGHGTSHGRHPAGHGDARAGGDRGPQTLEDGGRR